MPDEFFKVLATKPPDYRQQVLAALGEGTNAHQRAVEALAALREPVSV